MTTVRKPKPAVPSSSGGKLFTMLAAFYDATNMHVDRAMLFGFDCLRTDGKVFAKLHAGNLVIKLPAKRVAVLINSGRLGAYVCRGRLMKEWAIAATIGEKDIIALAEESRTFTKG